MEHVAPSWPLVLFAMGAALRLALFAINHPLNAYDDHFEPIFRILRFGRVPGALDCPQCYHPPLFYAASAALARALSAAQVSTPALLKCLQFVSCAAGIGTLWLVLLILRRVRLTTPARTLAFAVVCFLPRHVYMSALHSNDSLSYLATAATTYVALRILDGDRGLRWFALLATTMTISIFTKYTGLMVVPAVTVALAGVARVADHRRLVVAAVAIPLLVFGAKLASNASTYGTLLPNNGALYGGRPQPRDTPRPDFLSFAPWRFVADPIVKPGQLSSFWTLMHAGMWFDIEAVWLKFASTASWWGGFVEWARGDAPFPSGRDATVRPLLIVGSALEIVGLLVLLVALAGLARCFVSALRVVREADEEAARDAFFIVLFGVAAAGCAFWSVQIPAFSYSSMKSAYLLGALPAIAVFVAKGFEALERVRGGRPAAALLVAALGGLVTVNVVQFATAVRFG